MNEIVIWAIVCPGRAPRLGCSNAAYAPIPFGAEIIARVKACDKDLMWRWVKKRVKRGWSLDRIRAACE